MMKHLWEDWIKPTGKWNSLCKNTSIYRQHIKAELVTYDSASKPVMWTHACHLSGPRFPCLLSEVKRIGKAAEL